MVDAPWLTLLGVGDDGLDSLTPPARKLFGAARTIIAPERVLANIECGDREVIAWTFGVKKTIKLLLERRGQPVTVLATGDPMHFGIGATMMRHIEPGEMQVIPAPSAFSLAAARLGWTLQEVASISLHGRSVHGLAAHLSPGRRIIALTSTGRTIGEAAQILVDRGYGASTMIVLEHMGGVDERISRHRPNDVLAGNTEFAAFNTLAVDCIADENTQFLASVPGLPDEAFEHDGQLTKREVRAITLAHLGPYPGALLWDIGAGNGSIGIEWMRAASNARAIAIEADSERALRIAANTLALGTPTLEIIEGKAPIAIAGLDIPDAIFIGGGISDRAVFDTAWSALRPGGRLVANTVTLEGEARLLELYSAHGGEIIRIQVSRTEPVGRFSGWKSLMQVTLWSVRKGASK